MNVATNEELTRRVVELEAAAAKRDAEIAALKARIVALENP